MSQGSHGSHDMGKHALIMLLCCLIPVVILLVIWFTGFSSSTLSAFVPLLCPLLMFGGMAFMMWPRKDNKTSPGIEAPADKKGTEGHEGHYDK